MKKKNLSIVLLLLIGFSAFTTKIALTDYSVIPEKSQVNWIAYKVGGQHEGTVNIKSGSFKSEDNNIIEGDFVMDMPTLKLTDSESKKLMRHLWSQDFFDIENFSESKLHISSSEPIVPGKKFKVKGELTIRDKTEPIEFETTVTAQTENFITYKSTISVDRTKFGIVYRSSLVGDTFINDNFELTVSLIAKKQ